MDIINYKTFIVPRYLCDILNQMNDVYTGNELSQAIIAQFLLSLMKIVIFQIVLTTFLGLVIRFVYLPGWCILYKIYKFVHFVFTPMAIQ